jgi:hypothetical protein
VGGKMDSTKNPISIMDVKHSSDIVQIKLKNEEMPGWFSILQLEPGEIAYLIEQRFRDIPKDKQSNEPTFEGDQGEQE